MRRLLKLGSLLVLDAFLPHLAWSCPSDIQSLTSQLLPDLPSYMNRTYTRIGFPNRQVIAASSPEFDPLPVVAELPSQAHPQQVFVSLLEKRIGSQPTSQTAYWLFFSQTRRGWRLGMAFARAGNAPPYNVSDGAIANAVNTWLRDHCSSP
jgi:hypothetical protein